MLQPLLKGIRLAPFVECPHCHALSQHGTPECKLCNTKLDSKDLNLIVAVNLGARYTPFIECPNCQRLVKVGTTRCPDCYEEIAETYALTSAATVVFNTVACDVANDLRSFDTFAMLIVPVGIGVYFIDRYSFGSPTLIYLALFWPVIPLLSTILWFYRFGNFALGDDEYLRAKRRMRRTLTLWLAITAALIIALAVWWI